MVRHLRDVRGNIPPPAALAVVPADEPGVAALALVSLALSYAQKGLEVVVADLSGGVAARLLKISEPGLHKVESDGTALTIFLARHHCGRPDEPAGRAGGSGYDPNSPAAELVKAYGSADRLLTLAPLDPALGADHLATWASAAVVTVTAGQATAVKLRATGDMIRLRQRLPGVRDPDRCRQDRRELRHFGAADLGHCLGRRAARYRLAQYRLADRLARYRLGGRATTRSCGRTRASCGTRPG